MYNVVVHSILMLMTDAYDVKCLKTQIQFKFIVKFYDTWPACFYPKAKEKAYIWGTNF